MKNPSSAGVIFLFLFLVSAVVPVPARALFVGAPGEGVRLGNLALHPTLRLAGGRRSNIYLLEEDPVSDYLLILSPGLNAELLWRSHELRGFYRADIYRHRRQDDQNRVHHLAEASASLWFSDLGVRAENRFSRTSSLWETEFFERLFRRDNTATLTIIGDFNRVQIEAGYLNFSRRFEPAEYRRADRTEHQALLTGYYRVGPKTRALLRYVYDSIEYRTARERDGHFHEIQGGLRGRIMPRVSGVARFGWQERRYDREGLDDYRGLVGFVSLEHRLGEKTDFEFGWERTPRESIYGGNSHFLLNRAWLTWNQGLARKFSLRTGLTYFHHQYPSREEIEGERFRRRDVTWQAGSRLQYQVQRWLEASIAYYYRDRESNVGGLDYEDHRVEVGLSAFY